MTHSIDCADQNQWKRKRIDEDEEVLSSSIFDIIENEFQMGELVWMKFNGSYRWPAFIYGNFSEHWNHVKLVPSSTEKHYFVYGFGTRLQCAWCPRRDLSHFKDRLSKSTEEQLRNTFQLQLSNELRPFWIEAVKEADEIAALPVHLRSMALENILRRLLIRGKSKQNTSININSRTCVDKASTLSPMTKQVIPNKRFQVSLEPIERNKRAYSIDVTRSETHVNDHENDDIVLVQIHTPVTPTSVSLTTAICHFLNQGIPSLTVYEEVHLVQQLIHHRLGSLFTLNDAQLYFEQFVINIAAKNYKHRMLFVQSDYFYDFLLKYPQIILRHRQWFEDFKQTLMPIHSEKILLKKWQLATLLHAHINLEQSCH